MKETFIICDCYCHALAIHGDEDYGVEIAMWERGGRTRTLSERLRHIWYILKNGHPYTDSICIHEREKVQELIDTLKNAKEIAFGDKDATSN